MDHSYIPPEILDLIVWKQDKKQPGDPDSIKEIKFTPKPCEDCGKLLEKPREVRINISQNKLIQPHTKHHCLNCKFYKNPDNNNWDCTFNDIQNRFRLSQKNKSDK